MKTVGIIGGSGFIGSFVTQKFLDEGYTVKVSVTDIGNTNKYQHLFQLKNSDYLTISQLLVENLEALKIFIEDCELVIHGGTPFQLNFEDAQKELFDPTIQGTENFLEAVSENPNIKKVVLIASVAGWNTNFPLPAANKTATETFDETDERFTSNESHPYAQAKFIANQTVLDFIAENPELFFEITSVSPVMVMGKSLSEREDSTSTGVQFLIKNNIAPDDFFQSLYDADVAFAIVDVRDVAEAIFKAATTNGLHGKDYLLSSESYAVSDVSLLLNNKAPKHPAAIIYKNSLARTDLGMQFRPVAETLQGNQIPFVK
tara:strand:- start:24950 stop:25900 length:951 start_codon:yes stop_codon:yes gene_type:complete